MKDEFLGEVVVEVEVMLRLGGDFCFPFLWIVAHHGFELFLGKVREFVGIEVGEARRPTNLGFVTRDTAVAAINDPFEDAHVFAEARPEKVAVFITSEPVDVKEARDVFNLAAHI